MNIGKHIFKRALRDIQSGVCGCNHHHHHESIASSLVKAATVVAGVAVANEVIKKHYNEAGIQGAVEDIISSITGTNVSGTERRNAYADNIVAKLAACSYVAKTDNNITAEEKAELDKSIREIYSISNLPANYKKEIAEIMESEYTSFSSIQKYLDRVDDNILVTFLVDLQNVARASGGISTDERNAIDVYKAYVTRKTGFPFPDDDSIQEIDLTCPGCAGAMELDETYGRAICPYCGNVKLVDPNLVSRILGK